LVRRQFKPEQIINKLRAAEVLISQGSTIGQAGRKIGMLNKPITSGVESIAEWL
jgi:hypothetical protein